jgi:hypothetical protein
LAVPHSENIGCGTGDRRPQVHLLRFSLAFIAALGSGAGKYEDERGGKNEQGPAHNLLDAAFMEEIRELQKMGVHAALGMAIYTGRLDLGDLASL